MTKYRRLTLLCAVLAGIVAAAFLFGLLGSKDAPASYTALNVDAGQLTASKVDRLVAEILKRPLFSQGRQPPQPKIVKAEPPKLQGRLAGVVLRSDLREALFTRPGGRPVSVKEGEIIDGWTISRVEAGQVVLTSAFGEKIVKPTYGTLEEIVPGRRPAKKATPAPNQLPKAWVPQVPTQTPQQMASGRMKEE
jgi:type II secretory pathway component PulC